MCADAHRGQKVLESLELDYRQLWSLWEFSASQPRMYISVLGFSAQCVSEVFSASQLVVRTSCLAESMNPADMVQL